MCLRRGALIDELDTRLAGLIRCVFSVIMLSLFSYLTVDMKTRIVRSQYRPLSVYVLPPVPGELS